MVLWVIQRQYSRVVMQKAQVTNGKKDFYSSTCILNCFFASANTDIHQSSRKNIYIFIAIALDETGILVAFHPDDKHLPIMWSTLDGATLSSASNVLYLPMFVWYRSRIAKMLSMEIVPLCCSKTSIKYCLVPNIRKTGSVGC